MSVEFPGGDPHLYLITWEAQGPRHIVRGYQNRMGEFKLSTNQEIGSFEDVDNIRRLIVEKEELDVLPMILNIIRLPV